MLRTFALLFCFLFMFGCRGVGFKSPIPIEPSVSLPEEIAKPETQGSPYFWVVTSVWLVSVLVMLYFTVKEFRGFSGVDFFTSIRRR